MRKLSKRNAGKERDSRVFALTVVVLFLTLNLVLSFFASTYGWYFLATDRMFYTLSGVTDEYFEKVNPDGLDVEFYFCMSEEKLKEDNTLHRILDTVTQFDERYDFLTVKHLDTYYDFGTLERFSKEHDMELTSHSIVVYCPETGKSEIMALADFYYYDTEDSTNDDMVFVGEELVAGTIGAVLTEDRPQAIFTVGHGEMSTMSLMNTLYAAGFSIKTADISQEKIPDDCSLIVISCPKYDFEEYADPTIDCEIARLREFVRNGGTVVYLRDAAAGALTRLDAFYSSMGLTPEEGILSDGTHSIDLSGYAMLLRYDESAEAAPVRDYAQKYNTARIAASSVGAVRVEQVEGATAFPLLRTFETAQNASNGTVISEATEEGYTVAAMAVLDEYHDKTGKAILISAGAFVDQQVMETEGYGNKEFLLSALSYATGLPSPIGSGVIMLNTYPLEDMTRGTANVYLMIFGGLIPLAVAITGFVVLRRRSHR